MGQLNIFNELPSLGEANERLKCQLEVIGPKADLAELKEIFDRYRVSERLGLTLLHKHFEIQENERVVEYGHVSTPWPVPDDGLVSGGRTVPRSWRFIDHIAYPYEYGFNHHGEELYDDEGLPHGFVQDAERFLDETGLGGILGICSMGHGEAEGRVEKTVGRVSITVPLVGFRRDLGSETIDGLKDHIPAVWSFRCDIGLESSTIKLARNCLWCPKGNC